MWLLGGLEYMKKKFSRARLIKWLRSTAGVTLLTTSFGNNISTIVTNTTSTQFVAQTMEQNIDSFPKGNYIVKYERSKKEDKPDHIPYFKTVWAIAYDANLALGGKILNLTSLLTEIGDFEYVVSSSKDTGAYNLTSIFVKQPTNPLEMVELCRTLKKHASFVTVKDTSGKITVANSFINGNQFT